MKSKHQDKTLLADAGLESAGAPAVDGEETLNTSCKQCLFATYEGDTQVGCKACRIDAFCEQGRVVEAYDHDKEFYVINGVCNLFRPPSWNEGEADLRKAKVESQQKICVMVEMDDCNNEAKEYTLDAIKSLDHEAIFVIISQPIASSPTQRKMATNLFTSLMSLGINSEVVVSIEPKARVYDAFKKALGANYYIKIKAGEKLPPDTLKRVESVINDDLKRVVFFDYEGVSVINFFVFLTRYAGYSSYEEFVTGIRKESQDGDLYLELNNE